jgi:hypothetical protein
MGTTWVRATDTKNAEVWLNMSLAYKMERFEKQTVINFHPPATLVNVIEPQRCC